jgi:hypothetical protein
VSKNERGEKSPELNAPANVGSERVPPLQPIAIPKKATFTEVRDAPPRSGILFYVDNTRCNRPTSVFLDGKKIGEVAGAGRIGFQSTAGPHDLCLIDSGKKHCGDPGTVRRNYLHEGWTISLRCD